MIEPAKFERRLPEEWRMVPWAENNAPTRKEAVQWAIVALAFFAFLFMGMSIGG